MKAKGRARGGRWSERSWANQRRSVHPKLTEPEVLEIRRLYAAGGITFEKLAATYDVNSATISAILTRQTWRHI